MVLQVSAANGAEPFYSTEVSESSLMSFVYPYRVKVRFVFSTNLAFYFLKHVLIILQKKF